MKSRSRSNTLLIELLLVIFFFMCSAGILVQIFASAKLKSRTAHTINASMLEAENIAEDLYASDDPDTVLASYGFTGQDGSWELQKDGYLLKVVLKSEETETGTLRSYEITGVQGEQTLIPLPSIRYIPREVSP